MENINNKPLFIIIKREYFDQIKTGTKKEEFREQTEYWKKRLINREYSHIIFQAGYSKHSPRMRIEYLELKEKTIVHPFFGNEPKDLYALQLGNIIN